MHELFIFSMLLVIFFFYLCTYIMRNNPKDEKKLSQHDKIWAMDLIWEPDLLNETGKRARKFLIELIIIVFLVVIGWAKQSSTQRK